MENVYLFTANLFRKQSTKFHQNCASFIEDITENILVFFLGHTVDDGLSAMGVCTQQCLWHAAKRFIVTRSLAAIAPSKNVRCHCQPRSRPSATAAAATAPRRRQRTTESGTDTAWILKIAGRVDEQRRRQYKLGLVRVWFVSLVLLYVDVLFACYRCCWLCWQNAHQLPVIVVAHYHFASEKKTENS